MENSAWSISSMVMGKYYDIYLRPGSGLEWKEASLDGVRSFILR
jgi:hypothetical protein